MRPSHDRRTFLRRAAAAALGAPGLTVLGCRLERQPDDSVELGPPRPILLPWGPDAVRVAAPPRERPVAYMSHRYMQIWVDLEFRDKVRYVLGAHISVSTAHWRVPLPGDPPNIPIQPGDARREFEEIDMRAWDSAIEPTEGDVRVLRGSPVTAELDVRCQPMSGGDAFVSAEPLEFLRCGPPNAELCREDLMEVGQAARFLDRDCSRPDGDVRLVTWACREPIIFEAV